MMHSGDAPSLGDESVPFYILLYILRSIKLFPNFKEYSTINAFGAGEGKREKS
jgi:hypothetical protein